MIIHGHVTGLYIYYTVLSTVILACTLSTHRKENLWWNGMPAFTSSGLTHLVFPHVNQEALLNKWSIPCRGKSMHPVMRTQWWYSLEKCFSEYILVILRLNMWLGLSRLQGHKQVTGKVAHMPGEPSAATLPNPYYHLSCGHMGNS